MKSSTNNVEINTIELNEEAVTGSGGDIQQDFKVNIHNGEGFYDTGVINTFWSSLIITAEIFKPQDGSWNIIIRDKAKKIIMRYMVQRFHLIIKLD